MPGFKDLTGKCFGRFIVVERAPNKDGKVCWRCKCECGNTKVVRSEDLASGGSKSCGCQHSKGKIINRGGGMLYFIVMSLFAKAVLTQLSARHLMPTT
jgi:hypothetical protein